MTAQQRRGIVIPDELYAEIRRAAIRESAREGEVISVSEWLRRAAVERLEREKRKK